MFKNKLRVLSISIISLLVIGTITYIYHDKNSVKIPPPGSLFDLNTFERIVNDDSEISGSSTHESVVINGIKAYATSSLGHKGRELVYGSRVIATCDGFCDFWPYDVNGKLLYVSAGLDKGAMVGSESGILVSQRKGYQAIGSLFEIDGKLGFVASYRPYDYEKEFFIFYDGQKFKVPNMFDIYVDNGVLTILTTVYKETGAYDSDHYAKYMKKI